MDTVEYSSRREASTRHWSVLYAGGMESGMESGVVVRGK